MIGDIMQPTHLLLVLAVALLVLGPKRLPEVGRQLGNGIRDFRAAINGERSNHDEQVQASTETSTEPELHHPPAAPTLGDEVPAQPAEHQFAHETVETGTDDHQFGHTASEATQDTHQFAHEEPAPAPVREADAGVERPAGEHEFAYQPARPAEKPVDPLP